MGSHMIYMTFNFGLSCLQHLDSSWLCSGIHCPVVHNIEDKNRMWIQTDKCYLTHLFTFTNRFSSPSQALLSDFNFRSRSNDPFEIEAWTQAKLRKIHISQGEHYQPAPLHIVPPDFGFLYNKRNYVYIYRLFKVMNFLFCYQGF